MSEQKIPSYRPELRAAPLAEGLRVRLAALVEVRGEAAVMATIPATRATLARALAGLGIRRGTAKLVELAIAEMEATPPSEAG